MADLFHENSLEPFRNNQTIYYVESSFQPDINDFIRINYNTIVELFSTRGINFCYLPFLFQNSQYAEAVNYNRPYLSRTTHDVDIQQIYDRLISKQDVKIAKGGMLFTVNFGFTKQNVAANIETGRIDIHIFESFVQRTIDFIDKTNKSLPRFQIVSNNEEDDDDEQFRFFQVAEEFSLNYFQKEDADTQFSTEAYQLADEVRIRIQQLRECGSLSLIGDILEEIAGASPKLSSIFITNDYRIFLKDYGMKEVVMTPLPKSLYFLFLRHPEGIKFKHLANYHDELLSIYRQITQRDNWDSVKESIRAMTNPYNNSINEKCSQIRSAFVAVIADDLAKHYYVTGKRGEPKMITLDRAMVEFQ